MLNFRVFAGYSSRYGGQVQSAKIFRGGAPAASADVVSYDFGLIADLRRPAERVREDVWPPLWRGRILEIDLPDNTDRAPHLSLMDGSPLDKRAVDQFYTDLYRAIPFDPAYIRIFGKALVGLARNESTSFICCAAGKDRTGMLMALLGYVLGLANDAIMQDYLLSSQDASLKQLLPVVLENARKAGGQALDPELASYILSVQPGYLRAMFDAIIDQCGSVDHYLELIGASETVCQGIRQQLLAV
jgi:protein-tyrosine phosphatase